MRRHPRALPALALACLVAALMPGAPDAVAQTPPPDLPVLPPPPESPPPPTPIGPAAGAPPSDTPSISLEEIHRGMKGYGLSVFAGDEPERFEVEVLGVMRNTSPDTSYILARLSGHDLERTGVVAGMSGSPVFFDGRLAGAVSFGWSFSEDAIAGITPIAGMRQLSGLPRQDPSAARTTVSLAALAAGELPADLLARQVRLLRPPTPALAAEGVSGGLQWSTSGFGEASLGVLRRGLGLVSPVGTAAAGEAPEALAPGSAVAAVLVDGDLRLAATGTVTERRGDSVTAFGHPFLGLGPIRLPMATSQVVTVVANQSNSFKVANLGPAVGAFEQDRLLGIEGRLGAEAPMLPVTVHVGGEAGVPRVYHMRVAAVPQITPVLVAISTLGSLDAASYSSGRQGLDLTATFHLEHYGDLTFQQSFDGDGAASGAVTSLLAYTGFLVQNEFEGVSLDGVDVEVRQAREPRTLTLVGAHAERTVLEPGDPVTVNLDLVPYRGARERRSLRFRLPEDLPDGRYYLFVGDGSSVDKARTMIEKADPVTFPQALRLLRGLHSRRDLVALGVIAGRGLSVAGEVMPRLPGSVSSLWRAAASGSATPLKLAVAQQHVEALDQPLDGAVRIDLEIRRREPVTAEAGSPAEGGEEGASDSDAAPATPPAEEAPGEGGEPPPAVLPPGGGGEGGKEGE